MPHGSKLREFWKRQNTCPRIFLVYLYCYEDVYKRQTCGFYTGFSLNKSVWRPLINQQGNLTLQPKWVGVCKLSWQFSELLVITTRYVKVYFCLWYCPDITRRDILRLPAIWRRSFTASFNQTFITIKQPTAVLYVST